MLVPDKQTYDESDVNELSKNYILEQLKYLPGETRSLDSNLLATKSAFKGLFIDNDIYSEGLPITMIYTLTEALEDRAKNMLCQCQVNNIKSLTQKKLPKFPSSDVFESVTKETPSDWPAVLLLPAVLLPNVLQSAESLQEQSQILEILNEHIVVDFRSPWYRYNVCTDNGFRFCIFERFVLSCKKFSIQEVYAFCR